MDKFTNYNGYNEDEGYTMTELSNEESYGTQSFDTYENVESYSNQEHYEYQNTEAYAPDDYNGYTSQTNYTPQDNYYPQGSYNPQDNYAPQESYTPQDNYKPQKHSEYSEGNSYPAYGDYSNEEPYTPPNYDGVRLMDVAYDNSTYNTPQESTVSSTADSAEDSVESSLFTPLYPDGYAPANTPADVFRVTAVTEETPQEELTEAELADIRRQKVAARRKKLAARERRRRERRKQAIIRCSILLLIVILLIVGLIKLISGIWNHFEEKKKERQLSEFYATSEVTTEEPVADIDEAIVAKELPEDRDAALIILRKQAENDSTIQSICDSAAAMPDILLQNLAVNSEMKDFTLNYPAKINIVFDGNFEIELENSQVPLFLQYDERWGYADYSTDIIALRGAGPTALSMAYTYLMANGSKNPIRVADFATEKGYLDENGKTHWSLMTTGAQELGLKSTELTLDKEDMIDALEDGKLLICKMSKGDFTLEESYVVIREYKDGFFYINDPCSKARSEVGWDFKRLRSQIEKIAALEAGTGDATGDATTTGDATGDTAEDAGNGDDTSGDAAPEGDDQTAGDDAQ